jgi:hypothetical protein
VAPRDGAGPADGGLQRVRPIGRPEHFQPPSIRHNLTKQTIAGSKKDTQKAAAAQMPVAPEVGSTKAKADADADVRGKMPNKAYLREQKMLHVELVKLQQ